MKITAKQALEMLLIVAILCAGAVFLGNADRQRQSLQAASQAVAQIDPIEKFRTERQQLRAMQKAQLNDIVHDASTDSETAALARRQLLEICTAEEQELTIEGILSMRGFSDPVVTVHSGSVNVLIRAQTLTQQESSIILDLVSRETGAISGDIKIIPIN